MWFLKGLLISTLLYLFLGAVTFAIMALEVALGVPQVPVPPHPNYLPSIIALIITWVIVGLALGWVLFMPFEDRYE